MSELFDAMTIATHGMRAQGTRIRVISENVSNANTAATTPGADPYTRQIISFKNEYDREMGRDRITVDKVEKVQNEPFPIKYMPDHPGADESGHVKMPNVNPLIEAMDMREAQRTYEANLGMVEQSRTMFLQTIDLLRR